MSIGVREGGAGGGWLAPQFGQFVDTNSGREATLFGQNTIHVYNVLARHAFYRSEDAFLENQNGIYSFKRTLFSMLNNCISGVIETALLNVITVKKK